GYLVRVYTIALSQGRMNASKKHEIRMITDKIIGERAAALAYDQFVQETVLQKLASDVYNEARKVTRLRHVGVRKTKLIERPQERPAPAELVEELAAPAA
ncbi:MAG: 30S ribosomal protein S3ae, partial [Nitrososphaerales archaeon]